LTARTCGQVRDTAARADADADLHAIVLQGAGKRPEDLNRD